MFMFVLIRLDEGLPFFSFSTMSAHTTDIVKDGKVSLTVMASDFKGAAEGRIVLIGNVEKVADEEKKKSLRELYLSKHKDAYWIQFGDFSMFKMTSLLSVRYVGGFARAGTCAADEFINASPDPLAPFAANVISHMNDDHTDSLVAMVKHYAGVPCSEAKISSLDKFGMTVNAKLELGTGGMSKVRLTFPQPVTERKAVKDAIVEMTRASA
jgi:putative heme iron utilization protein